MVKCCHIKFPIIIHCILSQIKALKSQTFTAKWKLNLKSFMALPGAQPDVLVNEELGLTWNDKDVFSVYCTFQSRCRHELELDACNGKLFPAQSILVLSSDTSTGLDTGNGDFGDTDDDERRNMELVDKQFRNLGVKRKRGRPPAAAEGDEPKVNAFEIGKRSSITGFLKDFAI